MHIMGEEMDMFADLGWKKEIRSLGDLYVLFNPSWKHDIGIVNRYSDNYEMTSFLQFTQTWRWRRSGNNMQKMIRDKRICWRRTSRNV
jgi:hypothetical protein